HAQPPGAAEARGPGGGGPRADPGVGGGRRLRLRRLPQGDPEGLQMLKSGGTYLEIGTISPPLSVELHPAQLVWGSKTIVGMIQSEPWAIQRALIFLEANLRKYPFAEVISHTYPLERITEAFRESEWLGKQHDPHKISRAAIAPWGK